MLQDTDTTETLSTLQREAGRPMDKGDYEKAISLLQKCLTIGDKLTSHSSLLNDLAYRYLGFGWFREAANVLNRSLEGNPHKRYLKYLSKSSLYEGPE